VTGGDWKCRGGTNLEWDEERLKTRIRGLGAMRGKSAIEEREVKRPATVPLHVVFRTLCCNLSMRISIKKSMRENMSASGQNAFKNCNLGGSTKSQDEA